MVLDVFNSFRRLPAWVQIWVALVLAPVNLASLAFIGAPGGLWVAALAVGGMTPNLVIMARERGLSKAMAFPHLVIWTPLIFVICSALWQPALPAGFVTFLWILLIVDLISLAFDVLDAFKWGRGDRAIA